MKARGKVFISYRREGGAELARLVRDGLRERGYDVFMDVEDLRSGPFNTALFEQIESATDVVLILTPGCLDRCANENDWLRLEVAHAIKCKKNIVPVRARGFSFPSAPLPEDLKEILNYQGVEPSHDYFRASMDKLASLLVGSSKPRVRPLAAIRVSLAVIFVIGVCIVIYLVQRSGRNQSKQESTGADRASQGSTKQISTAVSNFVETPVRQTNQEIVKPVSIYTQTPPQLVVSIPTQQVQSASKGSQPLSPDLRQRTELGDWSFKDSQMCAGAISPRGRRIAIAWIRNREPGIGFFDPNTGTKGEEAARTSHYYHDSQSDPAVALSFSMPTGSMLAADGFDYATNVVVFDDLAHPPRLLIGHTQEVTAIQFGPDGETLASGSRDTTIKLWNGQTGALLCTLAGHASVVSGLAFSPDAKTLASASHDKTIRLWDLESRKLLKILTGHTHWVKSVAFSDDGKTLASGSSDTTVRVWDVETGKQVWSLTGHDEEITCVMFAPNSNVIASGSKDKTIRLWNARTGQLITTLVGHTGDVIALAFTTNSELISLSKNKTTILWDVRAAIEKNR
jgi:hypothetical protein